MQSCRSSNFEIDSDPVSRLMVGLSGRLYFETSNFASLRPADPILNSWKDLNPSSKYVSFSREWQYLKSRILLSQSDLMLICLFTKGAVCFAHSYICTFNKTENPLRFKTARTGNKTEYHHCTQDLRKIRNS